MAKKKRIKRPPLDPKVCRACFRSYIPKRKDQRYCTEDCRLDYYSQVREREAHSTKKCERCGASFDTTHPHKQFYCSAECREAQQKDRDLRSERAVSRRGADFVERLEDVETAIQAIDAHIIAGNTIPRELIARIATRKEGKEGSNVAKA